MHNLILNNGLLYKFAKKQTKQTAMEKKLT